MLHQLRPRFGRDEGARSSPRGLAHLPSSTEQSMPFLFVEASLTLTSGQDCTASRRSVC